MPRWQDRGEVQDSEDEDLVLDVEFPVLERLNKKQKLSDERSAPEEAGVDGSPKPIESHDDVVEDGNESWLLSPPVAKTYSRRGSATRNILTSSTNARHSSTSNGNDTISEALTKRPSPRVSSRSPQSSISENLPEIGDLFTRNGTRLDAALSSESPLSSVPSSPLSERAISPSPPVDDDLISRPGQTYSNGNTSYGLSPNGNAILASGREQLNASTSTSGMQRNFRTRKEKQLHPYMFDLAQYKQQFRERGLRPVRYIYTQQATEESQDALPVGAPGEGTASANDNSSSPADVCSSQSQDWESCVRGDTHDDRNASLEHSDEDLPDVSRLIQGDRVDARYRAYKRRRLTPRSAATKGIASRSSRSALAEDQDVFSVLVSPPSTSGQATPAPETRPGSAAFRLPRGMTPAPLPTPQVSSDRHRGADISGDATFDIDLDSRSVGRRVRRLSQLSSSTTDGSGESSESEQDQNIAAHGLVRERKRIKGVLPASWLKIDFQAQRQMAGSSMRDHRLSSATPQQREVQKGVAQVVARKVVGPSGGPIYISDDDDDLRSEIVSPSPPRMRQLKLRFKTVQSASATMDDLVDDERMEFDWIDPAFTASTRLGAAGSGVRRQPRITAAFKKSRNTRENFSEERRAINRAAGLSTNRKERSKKSRPPPRQAHSARHHQLSILDSSSQISLQNFTLPRFVRLAMRTARQRLDQGRHSPTGKVIRLSTKEDTEDANTTLRAWREGTVLPIQHATIDGRAAHDSIPIGHEGVHLGPDSSLRSPLMELPTNVPASRQVRRDSTSTQQKPRVVRTTGRPRMQQTRLDPVILTEAMLHDPPIQESGGTKSVSGPVKPARKPARGLLAGSNYRDAQLESLETTFDQQHRTAAFERRMQLLTEGVARNHTPRHLDLEFARFVDQASVESDGQNHIGQQIGDQPLNATAKRQAPNKLPHRPRKHLAKRIDAEITAYRQPSEPLPEIISISSLGGQEVHTKDVQSVLQGLGPFGTKYATDFDVLPLALGTYFHGSSFIGSGDFAASLEFKARDFTSPAGKIRIHVEGEILEWGPWTEDVNVGLVRISKAISNILAPFQASGTTSADSDDTADMLLNIDHLLRSCVRYITRCMVFLDPVDRAACVKSLQVFVKDLLEATAERTSERECGFAELLIRCVLYTVVLSHQVRALSDHEVVSFDLRARSTELLATTAQRLIQHLLPDHLDKLQKFLEDNKRAAKREAGIHDSDAVVSGLVILNHVLEKQPIGTSPSYWDVVNSATKLEVESMHSVSQIDAVWYSIFVLLPLLEIDTQGIARIGGRMNGTPENWKTVKRLVGRMLELYASTSLGHGSTINDYFRALLIRCYRLTTRWGWWKCESILGTFFDFFAKRSLAQLHKEESRGSPQFLQALHEHPSLEIQPDDRSFAIFLKYLAVGLHGMHKVYSARKIGGIAWRFIPNHGRAYRKDAEVRQDDLDALRNHHDLLCTLYYATPSAHRLRVELIQQLVDHSTSHREACRLNIRAWANLASFQVSKDEGVDKLSALSRWYTDMVNTTLSQYRFARTEAESAAASVNTISSNSLPISTALIEDTVHRNKRMITATLVDALVALKRTLGASRTLPVAILLLESTCFWKVFDIFEPSSRRLYGLLDEALEVFKAGLTMQSKFTTKPETQSSNEDSQDYGDLSALQEFASAQVDGGRSVVDVLHPPVAQLVSDILGADNSVEDALMVKLIDVWASTARTMVQKGSRLLSSYINDYSSEAWTQLRDTDSKRKFTPYFLSRIIEINDVDVTETGIIRSWLSSLVEREAMLKYQHVLTNALLNRHSALPLLQNLPFSRGPTSKYGITLHEVRQRRLSLVSSILSNMHQDFERAMHEQPARLPELRRSYAELLKHVMQAMKQNYQELQASHSGSIADADVQGAYVDFVQHVISSMQQFTTDICQIDRFFTDSSAFPLPAIDPTYVVGRLRAYVAKLSENRKRKELAIFIQTVSERAAVDNQQEYLVDQLVAAMTGVLERGNPAAPSLRQVLLTSALPAYIETALSTPCSWIVARPIIQACGKAAAELLYCSIPEDSHSVEGATVTLHALLRSMAVPLVTSLTYPGQLRLPQVQTTLSTMFTTARQCLTSVHFLTTCALSGRRIRELLDPFRKGAEEILSYLNDQDVFDILDVPTIAPEPACLWPDTLEFSRKQISEKHRNDWSLDDGRYFLRRGCNAVEVTVTLKDEEEEKRDMLESVRAFQNSFDAVFGIDSLRQRSGKEGMLPNLIV